MLSYCVISPSVFGRNRLTKFHVWLVNLPSWLDNPMEALGGKYIDWSSGCQSVMHEIWRVRNGAIWEAKLPSPKDVWMAVWTAICSWRQGHGVNTEARLHRRQQAHPIPMQANPQQLNSCFSNAGFNPSINKATYGVILFSPSGDFVAAVNGVLPTCTRPLMAKTLSCKEALSWLKDRGITTVHLHTDCSSLHRNLTATTVELHSYVGITNDCRNLLCHFSICSISLVHRNANILAHTLASEAYTQAGSWYWDSVPLILSLFLCSNPFIVFVY